MANKNFIVKNDIELKGNLIFEGATKDSYETTLAITDPTADRTITFPNSTGTVALTSNLSGYLTSESDTLETVTDRGASSTNAITISNTTQSTTPTSGALIISGGVGIAKDVWIDGDLHVNGSTATLFSRSLSTRDNLIYLNESSPTEITNAVGDGTYVTYTADNDYLPGESIRITGIDPAGYNISSGDLKTIYSATDTQFVVEKTTTGTYVSGGDAYAKSAVNPDLGFAGGYNDGTYAHAGLFRDASDNTFKFFQGYTPEPDEAVNIDTTHASFAYANIRANNGQFEYIYSTDIHATSMRTGGYNGIKFWFGPGASLDLVVDGTSYTEQTITIPDATGTLALLESPTFTGTVSIPTLNLTNALGYAYGGTGLTTLGTAGQVLTVNSGATGLEWATPSGGGGGPSTTT